MGSRNGRKEKNAAKQGTEKIGMNCEKREANEI